VNDEGMEFHTFGLETGECLVTFRSGEGEAGIWKE
jgi:hypothetical protein